MGFLDYVINNYPQIFSLLIEHIELTFFAVGIAILVGVPLGILVSYVSTFRKPILGFANVMQAVPSMALLGFMIPFLGIGAKPAIFMVVIYSLLPIIKNTFTGLETVNPQTIEAAKGIGMTKTQVLFQVQLPSALPVIMAGVRISAVTAVGLMTIASFVGAGGLGFLVFSGIRTVNNAQILAGAIPACLLALSMDYILSVVEKVVTPISLRTDLNLGTINTKEITRKVHRQKRVLSGATCVLVLFFVTTNLAAAMQKEDTFIIASKDFTEQEIMCHMMSDMIEYHTDITVERKPALGGTLACFNALDAGEIDMYSDYTGTLYGNILNHEPLSDPDVVYNIAQDDLYTEYNMVLLDHLNFNNTYTLSVRPDTAEKYNLKTISDLEKISHQMTLGCSIEFINREDGLIGLQRAYSNLEFKDVFGIDDSHRYTALTHNECDVIDAFSTDGLLHAFDLVVLEDDLQFFLPYYGAPIVKEETLLKYPEIEGVLQQLGTALSDDVMRELNAKVDSEHQKPEDVARAFLLEQELIKD